MGEEGDLITCCLRDTEEQQEDDPDDYDCEACPLRLRCECLDADDQLALDLYGQLAGVAELGLAPLVFEAHGLVLSRPEAIALVKRLGAVHRATQTAAREAAKVEAERARRETTRR